MLFGYTRVSTAPADRAGAKPESVKERPQLQKLLDIIREDDTVIVWKLDQLGRSLKELFTLGEVTEIFTSGAKLEQILSKIRERFGEEKAVELLATVSCRIEKVRPVIDQGQPWNELPV